MNTCVDYLKVVFPTPFDPNDSKWSRLFDCLRLDPLAFQRRSGGQYYLNGWVLDEQTFFFSGGSFTKNTLGSETSMLDMSGQGCRMFESRVLAEHPGENDAEKDYALQRRWRDFLAEVVNLGGVCSRVDLPVDDFSGLVPFDGLKTRLESYPRAYVSDLRSFGIKDSWPKDCDSICFDRRKKGYTATLGSNHSVELAIYDKKAEREAHGFQVNVSSWVRYEIRYYHASAVAALEALLHAFDEDGNPAEFIFSLLKGAFAPVENFGSAKHTRTRKIWGPWVDFVSGHNSRRIYAGARIESTLASNRAWLDHDAGKALARCAAFDPGKSLEFCRYLLNSGFSKFDNEDLQKVNANRRLHHLAEYKSIEDMWASLQTNAKAPGSIDPLGDLDSDVVRLMSDEARTAGVDGRGSPDSVGLSDHDDPFKKGGGPM